MLPPLPPPLVVLLSLLAQLAGPLWGHWAEGRVPILERDMGKFTNPVPGAQGDRDEGIHVQHFAELNYSFNFKDSEVS